MGGVSDLLCSSPLILCPYLKWYIYHIPLSIEALMYYGVSTNKLPQ